VGAAALFANTATGNTAIGSNALLNNTTGGTLEDIQGLDLGPNVAVGWQALESNTAGSANTAVGYQALHSFTTGPAGFEQIGLCTAAGFQALANATGDGFGNNAFGYQALTNDTDGTNNTAIGVQALFSNTIGGSNTAVGNSVLDANTNGDSNTAIGGNALGNNTSGSGNTALGVQAGASVTTANNVICIGALGENVDNSCYIENIFTAPSSGGLAVFVNSDGKLGTSVSSRRFKEEIKPMKRTSEALFSLKPVTFRYKKEIDPEGTSQLGLVAEEVEQVNPDLVVRDKEGKPYSVRYEQINAMLLNEFLKEHKAFLEEQSKVQKLEAALAAVDERLKQQAAQIQKVSAQVAVSKSAPQAVSNQRQGRRS
jgi:hypothetical protein